MQEILQTGRKGMNMMMKKIISIGLAGIMMAAALVGCKSTDAAANYKQAGLGGLVMMYDETVWTPNEEGSTESSIRFDASDECVLGVTCAKEGLYQHPLDMISVSKQIYSTYEGYEELSAPELVTVNDQSWYEWSFSYVEDGEVIQNLQRLYGENYYAYTLSYLSNEAGFAKNKEEALKVMNSVVMTVPGNEEAEAKAKEFLVGEWDMGGAGYLVIEESGTYTWYMDSSKDAANMHTGAYGCDTQSTTLGFGEGEGIYLVLFPEKLTVEGKEGITGSSKYDYGISLEQQTDGSYQMINATTFTMYELKKQ